MQHVNGQRRAITCNHVSGLHYTTFSRLCSSRAPHKDNGDSTTLSQKSPEKTYLQFHQAASQGLGATEAHFHGYPEGISVYASSGLVWRRELVRMCILSTGATWALWGEAGWANVDRTVDPNVFQSSR